MKITVDRLKCESNGLCMTYAPGVFDIDDADELVIVIEEPGEEYRSGVETAVRMCPKQALSVE